MKRGILTVVALLAMVGLASADYIMIKIDLNQLGKQLEIPGLMPPGAGPGGEPGGGAGPGLGKGPGGLAGGQGGFGTGGGQMGAGPGEGPGAGAAGTAQATLTPLWVHACLELKSKPKFLPPPWNFVGVIETKLGKSTYVPGQLVSFLSKDEPLIRRFESRKADVIRKKKDADRMLELASWALNHGMFKQFHETMEDFKQTHPKHAAGAAYTKTKADLARKPTEDDPAVRTVVTDLKSGGYKTRFSEQGHYHLLTTIDPSIVSNEPTLKRYCARLEETFEGFFYWLALNDSSKAVQVPSRRLLVVLDADPKKFLEKHVLWGNLPMMSDGFTPRRENVIFLSSRRTDEAYTTLEKNNFTHMQSLKLSHAELLDGTVWKVRTDLTSNAMPLMVLQTMVLIQKAMEEEGERTSVSHEGTRQLLAATGMLPRNVEAPEWVQAGMASFFDTPYRAFYTSMASPSWTHLVNFKHYQKNKTLDPKKSAEVLSNLVADRYFRKARQSSEIANLNKEDNSKLAEAATKDWEIARATAWSFTYYLAKNNKLHYLKRYFDEVSNLPRDLEFDDAALSACFARAFEMADAKNASQFDASKLQALAADWFAQIDNVSLEIVESEHEGIKSREPPPPPKAPVQP